MSLRDRLLDAAIMLAADGTASKADRAEARAYLAEPEPAENEFSRLDEPELSVWIFLSMRLRGGDTLDEFATYRKAVAKLAARSS